MEVGKRIMSDLNDQFSCSKKQRTYGFFNGGHRGFPPANIKLIDCILPTILSSGEIFNKNNYTLLDGRIPGLVIDLLPNGNKNNNYVNNNGSFSILDLYLNFKELKYVNIACDCSSVPSNESVNLFVYQIKMFTLQNKNKYVIVRSFNGYNQVGYMIIHYLMRTRLISVKEAIKIFADSRPPGILDSEHINCLYTFYHEINPNVNNDGYLKQQRLKLNNNDVIGDRIPSDQEHILRNICYDLLKLPRVENQKLEFPGSNSVPLNKGNMEILRQRCYHVSWKPQGTRYMMLIAMDGCYLIDSRFNFRRVQMRFPLSVLDKSHHLTLLDGEMVIDTVKRTGEQVRRYLVSDIMAINSISLVERKFHERLDMIDRDVIQPRKDNNIRNLGYRFDLEPFRVRNKNYWSLSKVPKLLKEFIPALSHESDSVIFQDWDGPYVPFTNNFKLNWKNSEKESVCFLYEVVDEEDHLLYVHNNGEKKFMAANRIVFEKDCNPSEYLGKIVECYWDDEQKTWICIGMRSDRTIPDEYEKYLKIARRIIDNVSEDMLVNEIGKDQNSRPNYAAGTTKTS